MAASLLLADVSEDGVCTFPHRLSCWATEDVALSPQERARRLHLAAAFLPPFACAEDFEEKMNPVCAPWEAVMDRHKVCPPAELLSSACRYIRSRLNPSAPRFHPVKVREGVRVWSSAVILSLALSVR